MSDNKFYKVYAGSAEVRGRISGRWYVLVFASGDEEAAKIAYDEYLEEKNEVYGTLIPFRVVPMTMPEAAGVLAEPVGFGILAAVIGDKVSVSTETAKEEDEDNEH
jgi:hypothetical protein